MPEPGNPQSLNRYAYSLSNPLKYIDPTGHRPCELVCPGDWINPFEAQLGSTWYGSWDVDQQRANAAQAEALVVGLGEFAAAAAWEPADWALTARDCAAGQCNLLMVLAAVAPGVPGRAGKYVTNLVPTGWLRAADQWIQAGTWVARNVSMPAGARAYQEYVTGAMSGFEFLRNGIHFDGARLSGVSDLILLDAKYAAAGMGSIYAKTATESWARDAVRTEAINQLAAANGLRIEWHVSDELVARQLAAFFASENLAINVIWTAMPP